MAPTVTPDCGSPSSRREHERGPRRPARGSSTTRRARMTEKQPAKGWYPDTEQPGQQRYWNGKAWTPRRRNDPNLSGEQKKAMEEAAAFEASPVGQAIAARKEG